MHPGGKLANWWDSRRAEVERWLDERVKYHARGKEPDYFACVSAAYIHLSLELGSGFVDILRLGQGAVEGGWGYGKDALRLLVIAGPVVKVSGAGVKLGRSAITRFYTEPAGAGICTWVSATHALRMTGVKHFATIDDLAKAAEVSKPRLGLAYPEQMAEPLRKLGAKTEVAKQLRTFDDVAELVRKKPNSVVLFGAMYEGFAGHTMYAFRSLRGRVMIADESGHVAKNLEEMEKLLGPGFKGIADDFVYGRALIVSRSRVIRVPTGAWVLALEMNSIALRTRKQMNEAVSSASQTRQPRGIPVEVRVYEVQKGDSLSKISQRFYGTPRKWRLIYGVNKETIGSNPNLIRPGMKLAIP